MRFYFLVMESIWHKLASYHQLLLGDVFTCPKISENLLADRDRSFNHLFVKELLVKTKIKNVEVVSSTVSPDKRNF